MKEISDALNWLRDAHYNPLALRKKVSEALYERAVLLQVFINQDYKWLYERIESGTTVIDIGGFIGDSAIYFAMNPSTKEVHTYEPLPSSFKRMQANLKSSGFKNIFPHNAFVLSSGGSKKISTEIINTAAAGYESVKESKGGVAVGSVGLGEALKGKRKVVIKCDAEGGEYGLFDHADLGCVYAIMLEYHDGPQRIQKALEHSGFRVKATSANSKIGFIRAWR